MESNPKSSLTIFYLTFCPRKDQTTYVSAAALMTGANASFNKKRIMLTTNATKTCCLTKVISTRKNSET